MPDDAGSLVNGIPSMTAVSEILARRLRRDRSQIRVDPDTDLLDYGLVDSMVLLDVIFDIEQQFGVRFDADGMDFEGGLTLRRLTGAFTSAA